MTPLSSPLGRSLAAHTLFGSVPPDDLETLVAESRQETFAPGETLMNQGDPGDFASLILAGEVAIEIASELGTSVVATLGRGDLVGELAAFSEIRRIATVRATTPVTALRIDRATIRRALARSPDMALGIISTFGGRLSQINAPIAVLTQATKALARGTFDPAMLDALDGKAGQFSQFAQTFREMAAEMREKKRLAQEMETAAAIQRAFLPQSLPVTALKDRFRIATSMTPAYNVGGDFFDYFMVTPTRLAFAVGDVSGKGTPAAMFMSVSRTVLKTIARSGGDAASVLMRVNDLLAEDNGESMFVTLAYATVDLQSLEMDYASGAHEETFVLSPDGRTRQLGGTGPALGLFEGARIRSLQLTLDPGDTVVFATDGVTEAFDPERAVYGWDRLAAVLDARPVPDPDTLVQGLTADVARFVRGAPPSDDITVLAVAFTRPDDTRSQDG